MPRAVQWNFEKLRTMYLAGASQWAIAREFHCSQRAVWGRIQAFGWSRPRIYASARTCFCGEPVWKRRDRERDQEGDPYLYGTRCLKHQREYERVRKAKWKARLNGTRISADIAGDPTKSTQGPQQLPKSTR